MSSCRPRAWWLQLHGTDGCRWEQKSSLKATALWSIFFLRRLQSILGVEWLFLIRTDPGTDLSGTPWNYSWSRWSVVTVMFRKKLNIVRCVHHTLCRRVEWNNSHLIVEEREVRPYWSRGIRSNDLHLDWQCRGTSKLSAGTTGAFADIRIVSELFPRMKEAWFCALFVLLRHLCYSCDQWIGSLQPCNVNPAPKSKRTSIYITVSVINNKF